MATSVHLRVPEEKLARAGALGAVLSAFPAAALAGAISGAGEMLPVAAGAVAIALLAMVSTPLYRMGSAIGNQAMVAVQMAALGLRLLLAVAIFAALATLTGVDMAPFSVGVAVGLVASVIAEMTAAARDPRFFWVVTEPRNAHPPAAPVTHGTERQCA